MAIAASSFEAAALPSGTRRAIAAVGTALCAAILAAGLARHSGPVFPLVAFGTYLLVAAIVHRQVVLHHPHRRFGAGNFVTLIRSAIAAFAAGFLLEAALSGTRLGEPEQWAIVALLVPTMLLDGLDGHFARRQALASRFGARFDMETDAFLLLLLCVAATASGAAGPWVLAIGALRYLFWGAGFVLPWLARPLPDSLRRKAVCVAEFVLVTTLLAPVAHGIGPILAGTGLGLLLLSFGIDALWLWRRRAAGEP